MTYRPARLTGVSLAMSAMLLLLPSCGSDTDATAGTPGAPEPSTTSTVDAEPSETASPSSAPSSTSSPPRPTRHELDVGERTVRATLKAPDRFRVDGSIPGRLHFVPVNVVTDSKAERWGDFFLFSPTEVHRPRNGRLVDAPRDLIRWFTTNPGVSVLSRRTHDFGGVTAHEVNVERDGSLLFPGDEAGPPGGLERYVLWQRDGIWLVGQASTFRGRSAITAPTGRTDVFMSFLRSVRLLQTG